MFLFSNRLDSFAGLAWLSQLGWAAEGVSMVTTVPEWTAVTSTQALPKLKPTLYAGSPEFASLAAHRPKAGALAASSPPQAPSRAKSDLLGFQRIAVHGMSVQKGSAAAG
jgi:hypothetical protein